MTPPPLTLVGPGGTRLTVPPRGARIGRAADNDLVLEDPSVSRHHCEIVPVAGRWEVRDLGSANGTRVDGRRVQRCALTGGEAIAVGRADLRVADPPNGRPRRGGLPVRAALIGGALVAAGLWGAARCAETGAPPREPPPPASPPAPPVEPGPAPSPEAPEPAGARVRSALRLAEDRWSRRAMAPENLWEACRAFGRAAEAASVAREPALAHRAAARHRACVRALDAVLARLEFTALRHERFGRARAAAQAWRRLLQHQPDPGDPRHQRARDRLERLAVPL